MEKEIKKIKIGFLQLFAEFKRLSKNHYDILRIMNKVKNIWRNMMINWIILLVLVFYKMIITN